MAFAPIPERGLQKVLAHWSGRGTIWGLLAAAVSEEVQARWTPRQIEMRANRILFEMLQPALRRWPKRTHEWVNVLPAVSGRSSLVSESPTGRVSWGETRVRFGWPPIAFAAHQNTRSAHTVPVETLRWTIEELQQVARDAASLYPDLVNDATRTLRTAARLLAIEPLQSASAARPDSQTLLALRREGAPWGAVADVAEHLLVKTNSAALASTLLLPDEGIRWRLFHLGVLGEVLSCLHEQGCVVTSHRPLGMAGTGPSFEVQDFCQRTWYLWFEAAGAWSHLKTPAPYAEATKELSAVDRALGADLLFLLPGERALILECKYSSNVDFVSRNGYLQAATYANEVKARLAKVVFSVAIGPESVLPTLAFTELASGRVGIAPPSAIDSLVREIIAP